MAVDHYNVYRDGGVTPIAQPTTNSYSDTGLDPETQYTYEVTAVDEEGNESAKSASASATTNAVGAGYDGEVDTLSPLGHWRLNESSGNTAADRVGGNDGTYLGNIEYDIDPLVTDSNGGNSVGLSGASTNTPHVTIFDLVTAATFTLDIAVQFDRHKAKHVLITQGLGVEDNGAVSLEVVDDGAGGLELRQWTSDGLAANDWTTGADTVPIGEACKITYVQEDGVGRRLYVDGVLVGTNTDVTNFVAPPSDTWYIGVWRDSVDPTVGLIAELAVWNSDLSASQIDSLARAQSVVWLPASLDAGAVVTDTTKTIDLALYAHPSTGFTVNAVAPNPTLGTHTANGEDIDYVAGSTEGNDDTFGVSVTKGGLTSQVMTVTIDVTSATGSLQAFDAGSLSGTGEIDPGEFLDGDSALVVDGQPANGTSIGVTADGQRFTYDTSSTTTFGDDTFSAHGGDGVSVTITFNVPPSTLPTEPAEP